MINRFWIFCGLVDHIEEHSYYYPSQLKTIVSQIKQLLYSLGYTFWIINDELIISRDVKELKIKDIKYIRQEEARCIMVDNSDHLYLTEDYIVTHNKFLLSHLGNYHMFLYFWHHILLFLAVGQIIFAHFFIPLR